MHGDANWLAYLALWCWVPFALVIYSRRPPREATALVLFGSMLFLPERASLDIGIFPPMTKTTVGGISLCLGGVWKCHDQLMTARLGRGVDLLWIALLAGMFATTLSNGDALHFGPRTIPGQSLKDAVGTVLQDLFDICVPFLMGRVMFRTPKGVHTMLRILVAFGLVYSLFILIEVRLSPQFHKWIYGFHQHAFGQTKRFGGYRPMVFMQHGLDVARFFFAVTIASAALYRTKVRVWGLKPGWVLAYCCIVLLLIKSMGAWIYGLVFVPLILFFSIRAQVRVASLIAVFVIAYPLLRGADMIPTHDILDMFAHLSEERSSSLKTRFHHEEALLLRASERPLLGWGTWGRNRIYDPETGEDLSITDGLWVKVIGTRGFLGFFAYFGLFVVPVWWMSRRLRRRPPRREYIAPAALTVIVAVLSLDLIPNGLHDYLQFAFCGALAGCAQAGFKARRGSTERSRATARPPGYAGGVARALAPERT